MIHSVESLREIAKHTYDKLTLTHSFFNFINYCYQWTSPFEIQIDIHMINHDDWFIVWGDST